MTLKTMMKIKNKERMQKHPFLFIAFTSEQCGCIISKNGNN